jgi:hypothetical protein
MLGQNHFSEPIWHVLTFLHPILICRVTYWVPVELRLDLVVLFAELVIFHCTSLWFLQSPVSWHQHRQRNMAPPQQGDSRKHHGKMQQKSSSRWGQTYSCFWVSQLSKEPCWTWETELQLTWSQLHSRCCMLCFHGRFDGNICNPPFCSSEITVLGIYFDVQRWSKNMVGWKAEASMTQSFFSKMGGSLALLPNIWSNDTEEYDTKPNHLVSVESLGIVKKHGRLKKLTRATSIRWCCSANSERCIAKWRNHSWEH